MEKQVDSRTLMMGKTLYRVIPYVKYEGKNGQTLSSMSKTFFEYLGIADMERIHSQILAWIFSSDCNALSESQKRDLVMNIFKLENVLEIKHILTESQRIDIIIETDSDLIVIENKLKPSQHSNQLERYVELFRKTHKVKPKFYFLTLIDEIVRDPNWKRISYTHIFNALQKIRLSENSHSVILTEYIAYLGKLSGLLIDFQNDSKKYDMVFLDGKKKKADKLNFLYKNEYERFIAENQLETILQKSFLTSLSLRIEKVNTFVTDTRGDALIDFHLKPNIYFGGKRFMTMIQLQNDVIKFAFLVADKYGSSRKDWIQGMIPKMLELSSENTFGYVKCNRPKTKAYISISKKLNRNYWHMNMDELVAFIEQEIDNGNRLTELLESKLN
ncbi:PD-(D/E)XK nuclease family protein [Flavobacterium sharifuzzamanii]|uniref:PD-(D/E)XK nuclease family protein n=1 Tax=Flavobacterium sharifuzzamanii TaxID=2211133 RepID=UPI000DAF0E85|nr:PD-(D/E)XK nuclease family protein [Flavobacterium sharifuzzamanii]KAF2082063.1 PD-(D/E)XK nuclease family protein [Flavobacterium sharifuzzamanii]